MYDKGSGGPREDVRGRDAHGGNDRVGKGADGELGDLSGEILGLGPKIAAGVPVAEGRGTLRVVRFHPGFSCLVTICS